MNLLAYAQNMLLMTLIGLYTPLESGPKTRSPIKKSMISPIKEGQVYLTTHSKCIAPTAPNLSPNSSKISISSMDLKIALHNFPLALDENNIPLLVKSVNALLFHGYLYEKISELRQASSQNQAHQQALLLLIEALKSHKRGSDMLGIIQCLESGERQPHEVLIPAFNDWFNQKRATLFHEIDQKNDAMLNQAFDTLLNTFCEQNSLLRDLIELQSRCNNNDILLLFIIELEPLVTKIHNTQKLCDNITRIIRENRSGFLTQLCNERNPNNPHGFVAHPAISLIHKDLESLIIENNLMATERYLVNYSLIQVTNELIHEYMSSWGAKRSRRNLFTSISE